MKSLAIYFTVFLISTFLIVLGSKFKSTFNLLSIAGMLILIIFAAGRYHVGTDTNMYMYMFEKYSILPWNEIFSQSEFLFYACVKFFYSIGGRVLTWGVFATLIVVPVYCALRKYYPNTYISAAFFSFLCLYYAASFNITRQFISVAFVFWGLQYVFENKFWRYLFVVLIATGFHLSAPVAILIWFLWDHKYNLPLHGIKRILLLLLVALCTLGYQSIIEFVAEHFSIYASYEGYSEDSFRGRNRDLYLTILQLIILWLINRVHQFKDTRISTLFDLMIISVLIGLTGFTHLQVKRLAYYFELPATLVLFGYLPHSFAKNSRKIAVLAVLLYSAAVFILVAYILRQANLIPYQFDLYSKW